MKLEKEIAQSSFRNQYHKLAVNVIYTHNWIMKNQAELFQQYDITGNQYNILRILRGQYPNPASINLLRERMLDKMSDASRLVERLRLKGLVERNISSGDRRKADVIISKQGLELLKSMDELNAEYDKMFQKLTEEEASILNELLDKLRD